MSSDRGREESELDVCESDPTCLEGDDGYGDAWSDIATVDRESRDKKKKSTA